MRVFFLTGEWVALERFVRGNVSEPEGMPSVYRPWLRYREHGYEVHVFMIGNFGQGRTLDWKGCQIHLVARPKFFAWRSQKAKFRMRFPADQILLCRAARRICNGAPPDIVYALGEWMSYAAWYFGKVCGSTCVKRIYGTTLYEQWFLAKEKGHLYEEDGDRCLRSKGTLLTRASCIPHFVGWLWPSDLMIITNDGTSGDRIADLLGISKTKYRFWLNGINKEWITTEVDSVSVRKKLGIAPGEFVLLCLSRLSEWKRQDRVVKAMPTILDRVPNAKLIIAGDGPKRSELERLSQILKLDSRIEFTGMVKHSEVREIMSVADIFLQTNNWSCLGNTLLEALACGRTIVTWDVGETGEVIKDGMNGCLLPDANPETIAKAVIKLAQEPEIRARLARGAREYAQEHLQPWEDRLDTEIDLIEQICARKSGRRPRLGWRKGLKG